jgi:hypothetical protein
MSIERVLAQMTVTNLDVAVAWYTKVFGRAAACATTTGGSSHCRLDPLLGLPQGGRTP